MRYRVRTPDGELDYLSFREVEVAYVQGLVGPDDEVREEGQKLWRKASTIPQLVRAKPPERVPRDTMQFIAILCALALGLASLVLLMKGLWWGLVTGLATTFFVSHLAYTAFRKPKRG
jgi:uncharacterized membrane protein YhhN